MTELPPKIGFGTRMLLLFIEPLGWLIQRLGIRGSEETSQWCRAPLPSGDALYVERVSPLPWVRPSRTALCSSALRFSLYCDGVSLFVTLHGARR